MRPCRTSGSGDLRTAQSAVRRSLFAEVVGFLENEAVLTPIGELTGISMEAEVIPTGENSRVPVGPELLGRVISPLGEPLDGNAWPPAPQCGGGLSTPIRRRRCSATSSRIRFSSACARSTAC